MPSPDPRWSNTEQGPDPIAWVSPDEIVLEWRAVGRFTIRPHERVRVEPARGSTVALRRDFARGPVAAVRLRQQGYLVLHGSAVAIHGAAVVFAGASGWGKSTLAAALERRGHPLLADDFAAIRLGRRGPTLRPTVSMLKLWPDSARALGLDTTTLPRLHPSVEKRRVPARRATRLARTVTLHRVVILAPGATPGVTRLDTQQALVELLRHSYGARTLAALHPADHFARCAALVRAIPVLRLGTSAALDALDAFAAQLEALDA